MRNTQDYSLEEVEAIILAHHAKHLNFEKKTHNFVVKFCFPEIDGTMAQVIATPKNKNNKKETINNLWHLIKEWVRRKVGERNTVNCSDG